MLDIIENSFLLDEETVARSWKERLFSWPWKPWVKTKVITVPSKKILTMGRTIICHPQIAEILREHDRKMSLTQQQKESCPW